MNDMQERRKSISSGSSPPVQQFATFKAAEPYTHIPTPALEPTDQLSSLSGPSTRGGPPASVRPSAKRDRSVDIFEKHTLTKPRVDKNDVDGQPFSFKTGAAAEFEKPVLETPAVQIMKLPLPRNRSKSRVNLMSAEDVVRAEEKVKGEMEAKERSRERGEAARMLMGNVQSSSSPITATGKTDGIWGLAQRARDRSRSSSRNRWEENAGEMEGKQKRRSLTIMTGSVDEEEEENPRTGRLGSRFH